MKKYLECLRVLLLIAPGLAAAQIDWDPEPAKSPAQKRDEMVWASAEPPPRVGPWGQAQFLHYRVTWFAALSAMTTYFSLDADGSEPSNDWEDHCDRVLVGLVDLLGNLQDAAPADAGLDPAVTDWIADETEAVSQLCEHGGQAAIVFFQIEDEIEELGEANDQAVASWNTLVTNIETAASAIEYLDDELSDIEATLSKAKLGRALDAAEQGELERFVMQSGVGPPFGLSAFTILGNLVIAASRRDDAVTDYLEQLQERESVYDDLIAGLPASLQGSEGTSSLYEKYIDELLKRRDTFTDELEAFESVTLPLRTGEFESGTNLPLGINSIDDLHERYRNIAERLRSALDQAGEVI